MTLEGYVKKYADFMAYPVTHTTNLWDIAQVDPCEMDLSDCAAGTVNFWGSQSWLIFGIRYRTICFPCTLAYEHTSIWNVYGMKCHVYIDVSLHPRLHLHVFAQDHALAFSVTPGP